MKITKITLNGQAQWNMGDDATEADAAGYRQWIEAELSAEFAGADIEINEADHTYSVIVEIDDESDYDAARDLKDEVQIFCAEAWERCPWSWVESA